jgi:hypothetical protein
MIVSDDTVSKALQYLADDPHPIALARKELTDAENEKDRIYAEAYAEANQGSIRDREMACERRTEVIEARRRIAIALREVERHKARTNAAGMVIEVWRSENANARAAERVR